MNFPNIPLTAIDGALDGSITYQSFEALDGKPICENVPADRFFANKPELKKRYLDLVFTLSQRSERAGFWVVRDSIVLGGWNLVVNPRTGEIYNYLPGFGWQNFHVDDHVKKASASGVNLDDVPLRRGRYIVLSFPGGYTFGHWLVDIMIRVYLCKINNLLDDSYFILPGKLTNWMRYLISLWDIKEDRFIPLHGVEAIRCESIFVPTITGANGVLNCDLANGAFADIISRISNKSDESAKSIIMPLHTTMSSIVNPRTLINRDGVVKEIMSRFDIDLFDPLGIPLEEQIRKFRNAKLIVGEDSSALHNAVWSDGADIISLLPPERMNFYHFGIINARGGRFGAIWGDGVGENGEYRIDPVDVIEMMQFFLSGIC